jgi:hypothetical protein
MGCQQLFIRILFPQHSCQWKSVHSQINVDKIAEFLLLKKTLSVSFRVFLWDFLRFQIFFVKYCFLNKFFLFFKAIQNLIQNFTGVMNEKPFRPAFNRNSGFSHLRLGSDRHRDRHCDR